MVDSVIDAIGMVIEEMEDAYHRGHEAIEFYIHPMMLDKIEQDTSFHVNKRAERIRPSNEYTLVKDPEEQVDPSQIETVRVIEQGEYRIIEDEAMGATEVLAIDPERIHNSKVSLQHPAAVHRFNIQGSVGREDLLNRCDLCGSREEMYIEGIEDDIFCTIDCLQEAYNDQ